MDRTIKLSICIGIVWASPGVDLAGRDGTLSLLPDRYWLWPSVLFQGVKLMQSFHLWMQILDPPE
jgi:hypothetical protein